jgi:hypothetical protein
MNLIDIRDDRVWDKVLETLSAEKRLLKFQKLPRHELDAYVRLFGHRTHSDIRSLYKVVQNGGDDMAAKANDLIQKFGEPRAFAMLYQLVGCMKCWVETESPVQSVRSRWRIAHG